MALSWQLLILSLILTENSEYQLIKVVSIAMTTLVFKMISYTLFLRIVLFKNQHFRGELDELEFLSRFVNISDYVGVSEKNEISSFVVFSFISIYAVGFLECGCRRILYSSH